MTHALTAPDDAVGAFVPHTPPPIAGATHGPLARLRFAVKDLFDIAGHVTGGGSPDWLRTHAPATSTASPVVRLLDAGADFIGKTVCDELFYSVTGENAHYGTPRNVRAPGRIPGGSSSGSAAAVAAGLCDFALGSDTGGSIRVPASFCGLFGLRPTHGRVDLTHAIAMAPSFDTAGWFTRDAQLLRTIGGLLLDGDAVRAPVTRVLLALDAFAEADLAVHDTLNAWLAARAARLPPTNATRLAHTALDAYRECLRVTQGAEIGAQFRDWIAATQPSFGPGVRERMAMACAITADEAASARAGRAAVRAHLAALVVPGTVVCVPSAPCIAPPCGQDAQAADAFRRRTMALTASASLGGLPQVSLPAGTVEGCPVGIGFIGWAGGDEALLELAQVLATG